MNPNITLEFIDREMERDPEAGRSEWLAEFREDVEAAFSLESIEQCVIRGRTELLPAQSVSYVAFVDPSGGRRDQFTVAVAHSGKENAIIDLVRGWKPPFDPSEVAKECAGVLKPYRIRTVIGDAYGGEWPREQFRKHNLVYQLSEKNRSQLYLDLIPVVCSKRVELLDNRKLIDELRRLERRRGRSGKDTVDHPAYGGSDDIANAVAGAIDLVIAKPQMSPQARPMGVGKGLGHDIRKAFGSTFGPMPASGPDFFRGVSRSPAPVWLDRRSRGAVPKARSSLKEVDKNQDENVQHVENKEVSLVCKNSVDAVSRLKTSKASGEGNRLDIARSEE